MKPAIIDTHAHLDMADFDPDRREVIARALDSGVSQIITIGIDVNSSREAIKLATRYPQIWATVGIHPHEADLTQQGDIDTLDKIAGNPRVVALGEIGLDYFRNRSSRESQIKVLKWQLELSDKLGLPVIIHSRQADNDMYSLLYDWNNSRRRSDTKHQIGVIHCFSGDAEIARKYIDMGFFISFGAYIGYPSSLPIHNTVKSIPEDRLVVETDCPFLPPQKYRGKRNEPSYMVLTVDILAQIRGVTADIIAQVTSRNARQLFRLPGPGQ